MAAKFKRGDVIIYKKSKKQSLYIIFIVDKGHYWFYNYEKNILNSYHKVQKVLKQAKEEYNFYKKFYPEKTKKDHLGSYATVQEFVESEFRLATKAEELLYGKSANN